MASYPIRADWFGWEGAGGGAVALPAGWEIVKGDASMFASHLPIPSPAFVPVPGVGQRWEPAYPAAGSGATKVYFRVFKEAPNAGYNNQIADGSDGDWLTISNTELPADVTVYAIIGTSPSTAPGIIRITAPIHLEPSPAP